MLQCTTVTVTRTKTGSVGSSISIHKKLPIYSQEFENPIMAIQGRVHSKNYVEKYPNSMFLA